MGDKTKKGIRYFYLIPHILVRLAGIEPTTPWFVAKYSIQLSYSREAKIITLSSCFFKVIITALLNHHAFVFVFCPTTTACVSSDSRARPPKKQHCRGASGVCPAPARRSC